MRQQDPKTLAELPKPASSKKLERPEPKDGEVGVHRAALPPGSMFNESLKDYCREAIGSGA